MSWEEHERLFKALPAHLCDMCLFAVNTGCRDQEVYGLRWDYEVEIPELINLIDGTERVCSRNGSKLGTVVTLRKKNPLRFVANQRV
jgi:hypothetical protein